MASIDGFIPSLATCQCSFIVCIIVLFLYLTNEFFFFSGCYRYWCVDAYSDQHIVYKWMEGPRNSVGIDLSVQLPQFSVRGYRAKNKTEVLSTGIFGVVYFYNIMNCGLIIGKKIIKDSHALTDLTL